MADFKQISVLASGNPAGNAGVGPIVMFNNPQFDVNNDTHGGLGDNDYYFSLKIEENYTVYKLIKNNVRSFQAVRGGYLAIAFSIPCRYELVSTNPYRVLMDLWNTFRDSCMTLKDSVNQIYEFNSRNIDKDVLNEVAGGYMLRAANKAYHPMDSQSSQIGLVVRPEEKIEELLKDVQYSEFSSFKEILIAEQANNTTNYDVLSGIQIPRPVSYAVVVDGMQRDLVADINKVIEVSSTLNPVFYQNDTKKFSVSELQDGRLISGVTLDEAKEQVIVSTDGWASPKCQKYHIKIAPPKGELYFFRNKGLLQVSIGGKSVQPDENFDFVLTGDEIGYVTSDKIKLNIADKEYRQLSPAVFKGNNFCVTVEKTTAEADDRDVILPGKRPIPKNEKETPFVTVKLSLNRSLLKEIESDCLKLKVRCRVNNETILSMQVHFTSSSKDNSYVEGCISIPKEWKSVYNVNIGYKIGEVWYDSINSVYFNKEGYKFAEKDLKREERSSGLFSKRIVMIVCAFLLFAGGFCVGWFFEGPNEDKSDQDAVVSTDNLEPGNHERYKEDQQRQNDYENYLNANVGPTLRRDDVTFAKILELENNIDVKYKGIQANGDTPKMLRDKLSAYVELVQAIRNRNVEKAKELANGNLIEKAHADQVGKLDDRNIASVKSFAEIQETPDPTPVVTTAPVTDSSTPSTPPAARSTGTGALKFHEKSNGTKLWRCEDNVAAGGDAKCTMKFPDEAGLKVHIQKKAHKYNNR